MSDELRAKLADKACVYNFGVYRGDQLTVAERYGDWTVQRNGLLYRAQGDLWLSAQAVTSPDEFQRFVSLTSFTLAEAVEVAEQLIDLDKLDIARAEHGIVA